MYGYNIQTYGNTIQVFCFMGGWNGDRCGEGSEDLKVKAKVQWQKYGLNSVQPFQYQLKNINLIVNYPKLAVS